MNVGGNIINIRIAMMGCNSKTKKVNHKIRPAATHTMNASSTSNTITIIHASEDTCEPLWPETNYTPSNPEVTP